MKFFTMKLSREGVTLTAYLLDKSAELGNADIHPAVLIFPGGGYTMCSDREAEPVALGYLAEGYNAFVLRYTVGKDSCPTALMDAEEALETLRQRAGEWNIDPGKIACMGFSAGGHLAASLGTMGQVRPNALILGYPCILEKTGIQLGQVIPGVDDKVDSATPPGFIFATRKDALVPVANSLAFAEALEKAGIDFELHIFQEGDHGLSLAKPLTANGKENMVNPVFSQWLPMSVTWLKTLWGDFLTGDAYEEIALKKYGVLKTTLSFLMKKEALWKAIIEKAPPLKQLVENPMAVNTSIAVLANYIPGLTSEMLSEIEVAANEYISGKEVKA
jgi:acetyl esterase/lipase